MYKPSTYLVVTYFPIYLPRYGTYFLQNGLPRWNQNIISVEIHPQLSLMLCLVKKPNFQNLSKYD
jgi:hypothetical protein